MNTLINIILIGIIFCFFGCTKTGYDGATLDGKPHGKGTYTWSDGVRYVGEWKDGKRHGQGKMIDKNDFVTLVGTFKNDDPWDAKEICPVGGHLADFKDGNRLVVDN